MTVRFRDLDSMGHINNSVYSSYFEYLRVVFMDRAGLGRPLSQEGRMPIILARSEIDFLMPGYLDDSLTLTGWISHVGNKSFAMSCAIRAEGRGVLARARAVLVWFDYENSRSRPIPEEARRLLSNLLLADPPV